MKKIKIILSCMLLLLVFTFSACGEKEPYELATPQNLKIADEYLTWDAVAHADGYIIYEGENIYETTEPVLDILELTTEPEKVYSFTVMAIANTGEHGDSALSQPIEYSFADVDEWLTKETEDGKGWIIKPKDGAKLSGKIIIPDQFQDKPVAQIYVDAFKDQTEITAIIIPDTITAVMGFEGCTKLSRVRLPAYLDTLSGFENCINLKKLDLPKSLTQLSSFAFQGCIGMEEIILPPSLQEIGVNTFKDCSALRSLHIPASVTYIGSGFITGCKNLMSLTVDEQNTAYQSKSNCITTKEDLSSLLYGCTGSIIPEGIVTIKSGAFTYSHIKSIAIPKTVQTIEYSAFEYSLIESLYLPPSITSLEVTSFACCPNLKKIEIDPQNKVYYSEGNCIIEYKEPTTLYMGCVGSQIPKTITKIGDHAFSGYAGENITVPSNITVLGSYAFRGSSLKYITLSCGLLLIGEGAFSFSKELNCIAIPETVKNIEIGAFSNMGTLALFLTSKTETVKESPNTSITVYTDISKKNNLPSGWLFNEAEVAYIYCSAFEYNHEDMCLLSWTPREVIGFLYSFPTRVGYRFVGWSTVKNGSVEIAAYYNKTYKGLTGSIIVSCFEGTEVIEYIEQHQEEKDLVFYPVWEKIE